MCKFTIDDATQHATDVAQRKYIEGMFNWDSVKEVHFVEMEEK